MNNSEKESTPEEFVREIPFGCCGCGGCRCGCDEEFCVEIPRAVALGLWLCVVECFSFVSSACSCWSEVEGGWGISGKTGGGGEEEGEVVEGVRADGMGGDDVSGVEAVDDAAEEEDDDGADGGDAERAEGVGGVVAVGAGADERGIGAGFGCGAGFGGMKAESTPARFFRRNST